MRRMSLLFVVLAFALSSFAQKPPQITWLRFYTGTPNFANVKPKLDAMMAANSIAGWGVAVPFTHDQETWTHVLYVAMPDWSAAESVMATVDGIASGPFHDVVLRHLAQSTGAPTAPPKYIGYDTYVIKPGREGDAISLFKEWAPAVLGPKFVLYGFSMQDVASSEPWTHMVWYFMSDLSAIDAMNAAAEALPPQKLMGFNVRLRDMSETEKHRSQILKIVTP